MTEREASNDFSVESRLVQNKERSRENSKGSNRRKPTDNKRIKKLSKNQLNIKRPNFMKPYIPENDLNNIYLNYRIRNEFYEMEREKMQKDNPEKKIEPEYEFVENLAKWETGKHEDRLKATLKDVFKFEDFRLIQKHVINAVLADKDEYGKKIKHDVFCCMPTGQGKSHIFYHAAFMKPGFALVLMPLRALITDQMKKLDKLGIKYLSSIDPLGKKTKICEYMRDALAHESPEFKLILTTPDYLLKSEEFRYMLIEYHKLNLLSFVVVDEAHCIYLWGFGFKREYRQLGIIKKEFLDIQIIAMTATATKLVREDVMSVLKLENTLYFECGFNRSELFFNVIHLSKPLTGKNADIDPLIDELSKYASIEGSRRQTSCGIIFCRTIPQCKEVKDVVDNMWPGKVCIYHGELNPKIQVEEANKWKSEPGSLMIATVGFSMGVDRADVRFVIHAGMPP